MTKRTISLDFCDFVTTNFRKADNFFTNLRKGTLRA